MQGGFSAMPNFVNQQECEDYENWLAQGPFAGSGWKAAVSRAPAEDALLRIFRQEASRRARGGYASFDDVYGPLLASLGLDAGTGDAASWLASMRRQHNEANAAELRGALVSAWENLHAQGGDVAGASAFILDTADAGWPRAQLMASHMALEGLGMAQDPELARRWLEKACRQDFAPALVQLGRFLTVEGRTAEDERRARACFERAIALDDPETWPALGETLAKGVLGQKLVETGAAILRRGAADHPVCAFLLCQLIDEGKVQPLAGESPFLLLLDAAEGGYPEAQRELGGMLLLFSTNSAGKMPIPGLTPEACRQEAEVWLARAWQNGDAKAGKILASIGNAGQAGRKD